MRIGQRNLIPRVPMPQWSAAALVAVDADSLGYDAYSLGYPLERQAQKTCGVFGDRLVEAAGNNVQPLEDHQTVEALVARLLHWHSQQIWRKGFLTDPLLA